jgi:glycerophosphoryl diester phosphodiesterase
VPTLGEVLARYPRHPVIVEMKDDTPAMADAAVGVVREAASLGRVCLGSFFSGVLRRARRLAPDTASSGSRGEVLHAVLCSRFGWLPPFRRYQALQVPEGREGLRVVTPRFVRAAHRAGVPVQVWIVDGADDIRRLLDWRVDAVITDRPDVAVKTVAEWRAARGRQP